MEPQVKPTQEKQPAQIIIHIGTNDLPGNKNSDEIVNSSSQIQSKQAKIMQLYLVWSQEKTDLITRQMK